MSVAYLEAVREKAGLTVTEFTTLMPLHRTAYYNWLRRSRQPEALRLRLCLARAKVIEEMVAAGTLPLGVEVKRNHRMLEIRQRLHEHARQKSNG